MRCPVCSTDQSEYPVPHDGLKTRRLQTAPASGGFFRRDSDMAVKYHKPDYSTRTPLAKVHIVEKAYCDFCGTSIPAEFDARGFVFSQHNHGDDGKGYDACASCLEKVRLVLDEMASVTT